MSDGDARKALGNAAESVAVKFLMRRDYEILKTNYRTRHGEIDIVCRDADCIVFVEVKAAGHSTEWNPAERVNPRKQTKMTLAALDYLAHHSTLEGGVRFDVVALTAVHQGEWKIEHIIDAFRTDGDAI